MREKLEAKPIICHELDEAEQQRIRRDFFAAGAEHWLPLLGSYSFATASIPLSREMSVGLSQRFEGELLCERQALEGKIDSVIAEQGWSKVFCKLSTRSPKDAPQILAKAAKQFHAEAGLEMPVDQRVRQFAELVQQNFSVSCGRDAVDLLISSERVREDLEYALEAAGYDELGLHLVLRRWDGPLPIAREFRGIVWNAELNALGQYYHPLMFPELLAIKEDIASDLRAVYEELRPQLSAAGFTHFIIDFAWLGPKQVKVIELNPFDGVALGCFPGSTGLFRWDEEKDRDIIKNGPFEIRLRTEPLPLSELRNKLNTSWKDVVLPAPGPAAR